MRRANQRTVLSKTKTTGNKNEQRNGRFFGNKSVKELTKIELHPEGPFTVIFESWATKQNNAGVFVTLSFSSKVWDEKVNIDYIWEPADKTKTKWKHFGQSKIGAFMAAMGHANVHTKLMDKSCGFPLDVEFSHSVSGKYTNLEIDSFGPAGSKTGSGTGTVKPQDANPPEPKTGAEVFGKVEDGSDVPF